MSLRSRFGIAISFMLVLVLAAPVMGQLTENDIAQLKERAKAEEWTFEISANPATQYSLDQLCGLVPPSGWQDKARFVNIEPDKALPDFFDWRDTTALPSVKNQGGCGSCWAFATVGPLECNIKLKDGIEVDLSEQWLVSCNSDGWDCGGGWFAHDYHEWKTDPCGGTGSVWEADKPYTATNGSCDCPFEHEYLIDDWAYVGSSWGVPGVDAIKQAILDYGPVSVAVYANTAMQAYSGGVFNGCGSGTVNHGVVLVGWDDNQGGGVWIMRNSWGAGWGENGYMLIPYGCSQIGYGACYINYPGRITVTFDYPQDIPEYVAPGSGESFEVMVSAAGEASLLAGSGQLHYIVNGGPLQTENMTVLGTNHYRADLPALNCGDEIAFYVSVEEFSVGRLYDPDPLSPHLAPVATSMNAALDDDFETDQGWTVSGSASEGHWERGVPVGGGDRGDPAQDYDGSGQCYLTWNADYNTDVDDGATILTSPAVTTDFNDALVSYARWYSNSAGSAPHADSMLVEISVDGGLTWNLAEMVGPVDQADGGWFTNSFMISDITTPGYNFLIRFVASDYGEGSVVEAGLDAFSVTVYECQDNAPVITTTGLPDWTMGQPYSQQLTAQGGTGVLIWNDKYDDLAGSGLILHQSGLVSGTPSAEGTISFTAEVVDEQSHTDQQLLNITVNALPQITTNVLPEWTEGVYFEQQLQAIGGTGSLIWADKSAGLAGTGLSLNASGTLSGVIAEFGIIDFTAEVTDDIGAAGEKALEIDVNPVVTVTTESLPEAVVGEEYSHTFAAAGGTGSLVWSDPEGDLQGTGLTLSDEGVLTGIPADTGTLSFTVKAADQVGGDDTRQMSLAVLRAYVCGDANGDENVDLGDAVFMITFVFKNGPAPDPVAAGDANCDGECNVADAVYLINYTFNSGPEPCCP